MSDEPKRPGCLTLSTAYKWHKGDRMEVVEYIKHLEKELEEERLASQWWKDRCGEWLDAAEEGA